MPLTLSINVCRLVFDSFEHVNTASTSFRLVVLIRKVYTYVRGYTDNLPHGSVVIESVVLLGLVPAGSYTRTESVGGRTATVLAVRVTRDRTFSWITAAASYS
jgi:hypothetical protein